MLEHLFGSRTRVKLLGLFFQQPDEPLFVREITRRIETQINAVRRELANLVRMGLLSEATAVVEEPSEKKRPGVKRRYYKVNKKFLLLPEVRALVVKSSALLDHRMDKELASMGDVRFLSLMGVFTGSSAPVDLLVIGQLDDQKLKTYLHGLEQDLGFEVNYSLLTPDEFTYRKDIGDKFLAGVLNANQHVIIDRLDERRAN